MEHPPSQQVISARINDFTISIQLLLSGHHTLPALVLLYAGIDMLGALLRPESEPDTAGIYFRKWVDEYMPLQASLRCTGEDLWGARCGLLHTQRPVSRLSRKGNARQLHYSRGGLPSSMQQAAGSLASKGKLFVDVDVLYAAFHDGCQRFLARVRTDPQLAKRVLLHSAQLFGSWTYVAESGA